MWTVRSQYELNAEERCILRHKPQRCGDTEGSEPSLPGSADGTRAFSRGADRKHRQTQKVSTNSKRTQHLSS